MCFATNDDSSSSSSSSPGNATALMLWANRLSEPKNERDAGMMPPPATTLPLNIRRSSLTGMLSCSPTDQISPPILKAELMDESSQSSILSAGGPETMSHDSMDHFPSENSMDSSNGPTIMPPTPMEIMMHKSTGLSSAFQPTMDQRLMEMATNVVDLRVKQEEMVAHIQEMVNRNSADNTDVSMFVGNPNNATDVLFSNPMRALETPVPVNATTEQQIQQSLEQTNTFSTTHQTLMTEAGSAGSLSHILSYPNAVPSNILSPSSSSPLSQDVMLNSQPASAITGPMLAANAPQANLAVTTQSESDIILNPTISPTMMCNPSGDPGSLIASQVTIGDSPILPAAIPTTQQTTTSDAILTNLMQPMSIKQTAVEVKNMILNAAADILSSEPTSINPETTMNALISLSQEQSSSSSSSGQSSSSPKLLSIHDGQSVQHFENPATITNILARSDSNSSVVVLAGDNQLIQNVVAAAAAQNATEIIQNQIPADAMLNHVIPNTITPLMNVHQSPSPPNGNLTSMQQSYLNGLQ